MSNYKRKTHHKTIWRKEVGGKFLLGEWSRMLHKWWKKDYMLKKQIKKNKDYLDRD